MSTSPPNTGVSSLLHSPNRLHEFEYLHQCQPHSPPPPQQLWCLSWSLLVPTLGLCEGLGLGRGRGRGAGLGVGGFVLMGWCWARLKDWSRPPQTAAKTSVPSVVMHKFDETSLMSEPYHLRGRRAPAEGAPGPRARVTKHEGGRGRGHLRPPSVFGFVFLFAWPIFVVALLCRCVCLLCETRAALREARATLAARETPL